MRCLFVMAFALLLPACASVQMATTEADVEGKRFSPPPGQAALYVYREGMLARAVKMSVFVNRSRVGALAQDTWFRVDLDPGQYEIGCTSAENSEARIVQLAADEIRFIEIEPRFGVRTPRCAVVETTAENGRVAVLAGRRAQELAERTVARTTPAGPISIIYRDDVSNRVRLSGVARYGGLLGRDGSVAFTVENERTQSTATALSPRMGRTTASSRCRVTVASAAMAVTKERQVTRTTVSSPMARPRVAFRLCW